MATYYVDYDTGNDANNGTTSSTPFKHCKFDAQATGAAAAVSPAAGDTWIFKGSVVYYGNLNITTSGTSGSRITLKSGHVASPQWGTGYAVLDGTGYNTEIIEVDADYIDILDLEIRNYYTYGIALDNSANANYNRIYRCKIHTRQAGGAAGAETFIIAGGNYNEIQWCEVYESTWNGINVQNANYTQIKYNVVHDCPLHGGLNVFSNTSSYYGMMDGNDIVGNYVYNCAGCYYTRYQRNCIVANNVFDNTYAKASDYAVYLHYGGTGGPATWDATGYKFYNNTIVSGKWNLTVEGALNATFKDNIFYNPDGTYFVNVYAGSTGNVFDYNCYYAVATRYWQWEGGGAVDFAAWKTASGESANAKNVNPVLSGYSLAGTSPCINTGADLSGVSGLAYDKDTRVRPQGAGWDMGAYEWKKASISIAPIIHAMNARR
jgi:hypothetical protein